MATRKVIAAGATGTISGAASILGSWQICHNLCLGLIAALGIMGITLTGMPLLFFTKVAVPLWTFAALMLGVVSYLYVTQRCISRNLIILNTGLIIAGTPFQALRGFQTGFWIIGGSLATAGIVLYIKEQISKKKCSRCDHA